MKRKHTGSPARAQAFAVVRRMKRPASLSNRQWVGVKAFLREIAGWYPNVYPGQERLARDMGVTVRTVQNYVRWAQEAGLLTVLPDQGIGVTSRTNVYHITELLEHDETSSSSMTKRIRPIPSLTDVRDSPTDPPGEKAAPSLPSEGAAVGRTKVPEMKRLPAETDGEFRQRVAAAAGERRVKTRTRKPDRDPARVCANFFANLWVDMVDESPEFRDVRPWESKGMTTGYLNKTFFRPEAGRVYDTDEVEAFLTDFIGAVQGYRVVVKQGQSAFMRFTGWWGRDNEEQL